MPRAPPSIDLLLQRTRNNPFMQQSKAPHFASTQGTTYRSAGNIQQRVHHVASGVQDKSCIPLYKRSMLSSHMLHVCSDERERGKRTQGVQRSGVLLLLSLDRLVCHLHQAVFGLALGEVRDGRHGLLRVVLRQRASLLDAVALQDQFAGLSFFSSQHFHVIGPCPTRPSVRQNSPS